jgi:intracellular sulfur oxidation DsrE/DsrF family protein
MRRSPSPAPWVQLVRLVVGLIFVVMGPAGVVDTARGEDHANGTKAGASVVYPPYAAPNVVFDFFLDHPAKMGAALFWLRGLMNPLSESPYELAPEQLHIVAVIHGTEIVTLAKKNYRHYQDIVERMRYYADLGVKFRVCALAAHDYGYRAADFYDFVEVVPSAMTELAHWQMRGYALIIPQVPVKELTIEGIR